MAIHQITPNRWSGLLTTFNDCISLGIARATETKPPISGKQVRQDLRERTKDLSLDGKMALRTGLVKLARAVGSDILKEIQAKLKNQLPELIQQGKVALIDGPGSRDSHYYRTFKIQIPDIDTGHVEIITHGKSGDTNKIDSVQSVMWEDRTTGSKTNIASSSVKARIIQNVKQLEELRLATK